MQLLAGLNIAYKGISNNTKSAPKFQNPTKCMGTTKMCLGTTTQTHLGQEKGKPGGKEEAGNRKLLPAITTICTYNVGGAALLQF
jgi:hypothetical protein